MYRAGAFSFHPANNSSSSNSKTVKGYVGYQTQRFHLSEVVVVVVIVVLVVAIVVAVMLVVVVVVVVVCSRILKKHGHVGYQNQLLDW